jgi:AraC-like DNA-binding protein
VVSWIAGADEAAMLAALGTALGAPFADRGALTAHLLTQKSYAPTHESAVVTLMANAACRARAAQLLKAGEGNVGEVAYAVGFRSVSHFTRRFRERYGRTPSEWRKEP